jgi:hypothetical protein
MVHDCGLMIGHGDLYIILTAMHWGLGKRKLEVKLGSRRGAFGSNGVFILVWLTIV